MTDSRIGIIHVHSNYSSDGKDSLETLRAFALARDISWIGLTDHAEDFTADRFAEYVERCETLSDLKVRLIPGLEFRFAGFTGLHLLALGLTHWMEPGTPDDFIRDARHASRFTIAAHPVLCDYQLPVSVAESIDAIEVWNAVYNTRFLPDPKAIRLLHACRARRSAVVGTAGLDQHDSRNDREIRVLVALGEMDPLGALKAGRFVSVGRTMRLEPDVPLAGFQLVALTLARMALQFAERLQHYGVTAFRKGLAR
ncbi:MAG: PHP domain-containing protein [Gemmatimonadaceae bacterium]|nr:PHP domain-containing protein [Gemmatimonadaceae bacterium]MDQ3518432.1 PHP domain-containing protein [Gemmatimonadota bacterium]